MATDNSVSTNPPAMQKLQEFLEKEGIELRLSQQKVRYMQDGAILLEQPMVVAGYKAEASVSTA